MKNLDREGIFKARPISWSVLDADSGAVAVSLEFEILAQWDGEGGWIDWAGYEMHRCFGSWWVVKKNGQINTGAAEQLAVSLGWDGDLRSVFGGPPSRIVQVSVKAEEYDGRTRYRAGWMNPEDYVPQQAGASEEKVNELQSRYGSLLRAAATATGNSAPASTSPADASGTQQPPPAGNEPPPVTDADVPF